jgi:hypothetical protein
VTVLPATGEVTATPVLLGTVPTVILIGVTLAPLQ